MTRNPLLLRYILVIAEIMGRSDPQSEGMLCPYMLRKLQHFQQLFVRLHNKIFHSDGEMHMYAINKLSKGPMIRTECG
jgi:hypothetical protein